MTPPQRVIRDENQRSGASPVADPEPLPSDVSPRRLRRGLLRLGGLVAIAVVVVELGVIAWVRHRFMDTPLASALFQIVIGGLLVFLTGVLIGSS